jgi:hydroxypyruvate reductase
VTRPDVDSLVSAVLAAAEPEACVRRHAAELPSSGPVVLLAAGKAAPAMAAAASEILGERVRSGLVVTLEGDPRWRHMPERSAGPIRHLPADHPLPTARNIDAAREVVRLVEGLTRADTLLFLLSGGASAMLTLPAAGLELDDLRAVSGALMKAGATIGELNCVRKHCETLKGGRLARLAAARGATVVSLILSDVVGDDAGVIGSGPTAPDATTYADALRVLETRGVTDASPRVTDHLRRGDAGEIDETVKPGDACLSRVRNVIVGNNQIAVDAAAAELSRQGFEVVERRTRVEGEAAEVGRALAARLRELAARPSARPRAVVWGGETTVTIRGEHGAGGRNQELALAAAAALEGSPCAGVLTLATDGVDGPTDAAGAAASGETVADARRAGVDPAAFLARHDSHTFFARLDGGSGLIRTGQTGTNVNDVMVGWVG